MPEIVAETLVEESLETVLETLPEAPLKTDDEPLEEFLPITQDVPLSIIDTPAPLQPPTEQWYAFWSPFRSELAANGFVSQLQRGTGMDYRVVRLKPGVYEVAFAYEADTDIASHLAAISAATGLDLPDG
jgi:hypothetical protein